jgi:mannose-1-phosphate guanylyltransferase/mannose-6-phosphate isomerase
MLAPGALYAALEAGLPAADQGWLVTFGITPSRPETGFGWIAAAGEALPGVPGVERAVDPDLYGAVKSMPIDKAVMERSARVAVVPVDPQWSDVGSWHALWELMGKDADGNAVQGDAILVDSRGCLARSEKRLVALVGVEDLAVVETADAVLVARREAGEAIRGVVEALGKGGRKEAAVHAREVRPWGTFLVLQEGPGYKVKEVCVDHGRRLTLQVHPGRDEHWTVVAGAAEVELEGEALRLEAGHTLRIARGQRHRLGNPGPGVLRLIETGTGEALGDEDTVRLED